MSYSPGQWIPELDRDGVRVIVAPDAFDKKYHSKTIIAECGQDNAADAHLIAAAPELLKVCEAAMRVETLWVPPIENAADDEGEAEILNRLCEQMRAAITKATGAPIHRPRGEP